MLDAETWADAAHARLLAAGLFGGSVTRNRETPSRDDQLPTADVFVSDDEGKPMGGGVTGPVGLEHVTKLCIEVRDAGNDGPELRAKLRAAVALVYGTLLPTFHDWAATAEGVGGVRFAYVNPPEGGEVEGRALIQIDILSRTFWEPPTAALPDFSGVTVDVGTTGIRGVANPPTGP